MEKTPDNIKIIVKSIFLPKKEGENDKLLNMIEDILKDEIP